MLIPPGRGGRPQEGFLAILELACFFEGLETFSERSQMRGLCKSGMGHRLQDVEMRLEGFIIRQQTEGVQATVATHGDVVREGLKTTSARRMEKKTRDAYEISQGGVGPQHALGGDTFSRLTELHADDRAEKVFDVFAVGVVGDPAWTADGDAAHDEGGEVDEGDAVEVGREETGNVLLEAEDEYAGDGALELGDGGHGAGDATVDVGGHALVVGVVS